MNFSKKNLLALAVAASVLSPLAQAAQTEKTHSPAEHGEHKPHGSPLKDAVVASWSLDQDKLASLEKADSEFRSGLKQLRGDDDKAAPEQRRAAMESLLEQQREQLSDVLTDEQLHAYQMLERPRPMMRHHGGPKRDPEQMTAQLEKRYAPLFATWDLSQDQSAKVLNAERTFFDGLHQMKRPDAKAGDEAKDSRGAQFKQLLEQRHSALSSVLDDEQVTAFEALTKPPRGPQGGRHHGPQDGPHHGPQAEGEAPTAG